MRNMRVGVMYYYRTNRDQIGLRNTAVPTTAYVPFTVTIPNGPGGTLASPKPMTVTAYNLLPTFNGLQNNVIDNQPYLDTTYQGVEFTAQKRLSNRWLMSAGFTIGRNEGGLNAAGGQSTGNGNDLNDPNFTPFTRPGRQRFDLAFRLSVLTRYPGNQSGGQPRVERRLSVRIDLLGHTPERVGRRRQPDTRFANRPA